MTEPLPGDGQLLQGCSSQKELGEQEKQMATYLRHDSVCGTVAHGYATHLSEEGSRAVADLTYEDGLL